MKKHIYIFLVIFSLYGKLWAQENVIYPFGNHQQEIVNPARTAFSDGLNGHLSYQDTWIGFKEAPELIYVNFYGAPTENMGISVNLNRNSSGIFQTTNIEAGYAYSIEIVKGHKLAMGLSLGLWRNNNKDVYNELDEAEPLLQSNYFNNTKYRAGFGISYHWEDLFVDFSLPDMYNFYENSMINTWQAFSSYKYHIEEYIFEPSVQLYNYNTIKTSYQFNVNVYYNQFIWVGGGYGSFSGPLMEVGSSFSKFKLGFAYYFGNSQTAMVSNGSNQFFLVYNIFSSGNKNRPRSAPWQR